MSLQWMCKGQVDLKQAFRWIVRAEIVLRGTFLRSLGCSGPISTWRGASIPPWLSTCGTTPPQPRTWRSATGRGMELLQLHLQFLPWHVQHQPKMGPAVSPITPTAAPFPILQVSCSLLFLWHPESRCFSPHDQCQALAVSVTTWQGSHFHFSLYPFMATMILFKPKWDLVSFMWFCSSFTVKAKSSQDLSGWLWPCSSPCFADFTANILHHLFCPSNTGLLEDLPPCMGNFYVNAFAHVCLAQSYSRELCGPLFLFQFLLWTNDGLSVSCLTFIYLWIFPFHTCDRFLVSFPYNKRKCFILFQCF